MKLLYIAALAAFLMIACGPVIKASQSAGYGDSCGRPAFTRSH